MRLSSSRLLVAWSMATAPWSSEGGRPFLSDRSSVFGRELSSVVNDGSSFAPLTCNALLDNEVCQPFTDVFGSDTDFNDEVVIACGTCVSMGNFVSGEVVNFNGGLRVDGKVDFPEGTKVRVRTSHVFVQGEFVASTAADAVVNGEPDVVVEMIGDADVAFVPSQDDAGTATADTVNDQNNRVCPVGGCPVGVRPIVVAGGVLDLSGLPDGCAAWTRPASPPNLIADATDPELASNVLPVVFDENFNDDSTNGWYGNTGALETLIDDPARHDSPFLEISKRKERWQGPAIELSRSLREQMVPDQTYYWSARIMLEKEEGSPGGTTSNCSSGIDPDTSCPELALLRMDSQNKIAWFPVAEPLKEIKSDGTWYDVGGNFEYSELEMNTQDVFALLTFRGPEEGVKISLDDFVLEHGSNRLSGGNANINPCASLVQNGDAEDSDTRVFPMASLLKSDPLIVKKDPNTGNNFFRLANRSVFYSSLTFDVKPKCAVIGSEYAFSMKLRSHAATDIKPRVILKRIAQDDSVGFDTVSVCPPTGASNPDFVTCEGVTTFEQKHLDAKRLQIIVITNENENTDDVDYDDVSYATPQGMSLFDGDDASAKAACWGGNAEVVLTSRDSDPNGDRLTTVAVSDGKGIVDFVRNETESGTDLPLSVSDSADFASEVALLNRNILFEGDGGHVLILPATQGKPHKIDGIELRGFGQAGLKDRYPINFHNAGDVTGTVVSRNSIVDSKHRCINLHDVTGLQVKENVCYKVKGHGYLVENGSETGNVFENNLGARTEPADVALPGFESEATTPATFFIANPQNTWKGNVAAGSEGFGYWFDLKDSVTDDPEGRYVNVNPDKSPLTEFSGNAAHSNDVGITTFPGSYDPTEESILSGSTVFRNRSKGIVLHEGSNVKISAGVVADNLVGIDASKTSAVTITKVRVEGYTDTDTSAPHCVGATTPLVGVRLGNGGQSTLDGVVFKNIDSDGSGCTAGASATDLLETESDKDYAGTSKFVDVKYDSSVTASRYSLCEAIDKGVKNLVVADENGNLNPEGRNAGFLVPVNTDETGKYAVCFDLEPDSCAKYCLTSTTEPLPATATASPNSAPTFTSSTNCAKQLVRNGNFDNGTDEWSFIGPTTGIELVTGVDGGNALSTKNREQWYFGMSQTVDKSCLVAGQKYEVSMDVKITKNNAPVSCEPFNIYFDLSSTCPTLAMRLDDVETRDMAKPVGPWDGTGGWNKVYGVFEVTADLLATQKLEMYVTKAVPGNNVVVDNVSVTPVDNDTYGMRSCSQLIVNGDAEIGDARFWFIKGSGDFGTIEIVSPGATGNHAFYHTGNRAKIWNGMRQEIDADCMAVGSSWKITFKMKLFDDTGAAAACDKSLQYGDNVCPMVFVQSFSNGEGTYNDPKPLRNYSAGAWIVGGWNDYEATFVMSAGHKDKESTQWFVHNVKPNWTYQIDDISMVPA